MYEMRNLLKDLKAVYIDPKHNQIKSDDENNPWTIDVYRDVIHNDSEWSWKVDTQIFSCDEYACGYLKERIQEKKTGIRIIYQDHQNLPNICGDGSWCRAENRDWQFSMLCSDCPKAHKYRADQEGLSMEYRTEEARKRKEFVEKCGELLRIAKPHLVSCEYRLGKEIPQNQFERYIPEDEYVVITCENGHQYVIPIEMNSLCVITDEIFKSMIYK